MSSIKYIYHIQELSKSFPGGKKCFENIHLSFLPGVKIGVVGVNGAGKSSLMKIMAGLVNRMEFFTANRQMIKICIQIKVKSKDVLIQKITILIHCTLFHTLLA